MASFTSKSNTNYNPKARAPLVTRRENISSHPLVTYILLCHMESSKVDEPFPTPPSYIFSDATHPEQNVRVYHVHTPFNRLPSTPTFSFSPGVACSTQSPTPASVPSLTLSRPRFVSYETKLYRTSALTTCPSCQSQVTSVVTYHAGTFAWLMCLVFVLCGFVLFCCLIPFFVDHFKDAHHSCPLCHRVLHVHKKTCCD